MRTIWLLAVSAWLFSVAAPSALAEWRCEGRTCGTTPWYCCCVSTDEAKDSNCDKPASSVAGTASQSCPSDCNCVLTVKAADTRTAPSVRVTVPAAQPILLHPAPVVDAPAPSEVVARISRRRGPPLRRASLASPSLRAPPVLTVPTTGS